MTECLVVSTEDSASLEKKRRKRLKKLVTDICQQIEFYFSDANLRKDRFLKQELLKSKDGYVNLDVISSFNKIRSMTQDGKMVVTAIEQSSALELNEDKTMIRRKDPLKPPRYDPDDCTVYVECLPKKADHEWLKKTFSDCGNIVYVSVPRYKSTGDIKGFAFIEFEKPSEAEKACECMNNPPPESTSRAGKFPKMRGNKRIVPAEFDASLSSSRSELSTVKPVYGRSNPRAESDASRHHGDAKGHDKREAVQSQDFKEPSPVKAKKQNKKRELDSDDAEEGEHKKKKKLQESDVRQDELSTKRKSGTDGAEAIETKSRKRRHEGSAEETTKSAKRTSNQEVEDEAEKAVAKKSTKDSRDEILEETSFEQRRLKIIRAGGKMGKRKRSLSEGDLWQIRFGEGAEEIDPHGKAHAQKTTKGGQDEEEEEEEDDQGQREIHKDKEDTDTSLQSNLDKKKRIRKKKLRKIQEEEEALFLRVISKREWLDLKMEYLSLQKTSLAYMKQTLRQQSRQTPAEWSAKPHLQRDPPSQPEVREVQATQDEDSTKKPTSQPPEFSAGTVMRLQSTLPRKEIRVHLENISPIAYIDLAEGQTQGFVRFQSPAGPRAVLQELQQAELGQLHINLSSISGKEEEEYWEKLKRDREEKFNSKQKKKKKKGINKTLQNAEKALTQKEKAHIRFDD